jgi:molybdopterin-guanine dinucleotide biosynthesis protein B
MLRNGARIGCAVGTLEAVLGEKRVFGFAGWSGSGKTTLIEQLIPRFRARGIRVSLIKHTHHAIDIDQPGKDTHRHRMAGCEEVLVSASSRWALIRELRGAPELSLDEAIAMLGACDLVLVEGYKFAAIPKLEIYRPEINKPLLHPEDANIVALASDSAQANFPLPQFRLHEYDEVIDFIVKFVGIAQRGPHQ